MAKPYTAAEIAAKEFAVRRVPSIPKRQATPVAQPQTPPGNPPGPADVPAAAPPPRRADVPAAKKASAPRRARGSVDEVIWMNPVAKTRPQD